MEKTEDFDLLELQELALKHKELKRQKTLEEKRMIVKAHLLNHVPVSQLSKEFGIWDHGFTSCLTPVTTNKYKIIRNRSRSRMNYLRKR